MWLPDDLLQVVACSAYPQLLSFLPTKNPIQLPAAPSVQHEGNVLVPPSPLEPAFDEVFLSLSRDL